MHPARLDLVLAETKLDSNFRRLKLRVLAAYLVFWARCLWPPTMLF